MSGLLSAIQVDNVLRHQSVKVEFVLLAPFARTGKARERV